MSFEYLTLPPTEVIESCKKEFAKFVCRAKEFELDEQQISSLYNQIDQTNHEMKPLSDNSIYDVERKIALEQKCNLVIINYDQKYKQFGELYKKKWDEQ